MHLSPLACYLTRPLGYEVAFIRGSTMEIVPLVNFSAKTNTNITQVPTGIDNNTELASDTENTAATTDTAEQLSVDKPEQALTEDQRAVVAGSVYIGEQDKLLPQQLGMHAENFSHKDMFAQQTKIANFQWPTTAVAGDLLYQVAIPDIFNQVCSLSRNMLQVYAFFKPTVTFRFQINATRFQCGKLLIFADPANYWYNQSNRSVYSASCMPFVEIDVSSSNSAEITVPFEYFSNYLLTTTINPMGPNTDNIDVSMAEVRVMVLNPLQNQIGDTTPIQVAGYMRMDAIDPNVAVYQHNLFDPAPTSLVDTINMRRNQALVYKNQGLGDTISKGAHMVGDIADKVSGVAKTIGDAAKDFFNFDKPNLPDAHLNNHLATTAPLCYMFGKDTCVRLATNPLSAYMDTAFSLAKRDETAIDKIIQQPSLVAQTTWSSDMEVETELLSIPVCPYSQHSRNTDRPTFDTMNPSWIEYMAFYHSQWSGDIIYRLSFASTQIHSGRLQISFEPGVNITPITGGPNCDATIQRSSMPYAIFDLREHKEFVFRVSYVGTTETKTCRPSNQVAQLDDQAMLYKTGNLRVTVLTPLRVSSNVAAAIEMNTWIAAAPNFRFDYPQKRPGILNRDDFALQPIPPPPEPIRKNQSSGGKGYLYPQKDKQPKMGIGIDASARSLPLSGPNLLKSTQIREVRDRFGDRVEDVRDLSKRPSAYFYNVALVDDADHNMKYAVMVWDNTPIGFRHAPVSAGTSDNLMYNMSQMYAFWCGSIRYKVIPRTSRADAVHVVARLQVWDQPNTPGSTGLDGPLHIQNASQDNGTEFEVPYITPFTQSLVRDVDSDTAYPYTSTSIVNVRLDYDRDTPKTLASGIITVAAGNDIAYRWLCFPPVMYSLRSSP